MNHLDIWNSLGEHKQKVIAINFQYQFPRLSNRARNALSKLLDSNETVADMFKAIPSAGFDFTRLPNIGRPTGRELSCFYQVIVDFLTMIERLPESSSMLIAEENRQQLKVKFDTADDLHSILEKKAIEIGHFPAFLAIQVLLGYKPLLDKYRATFFKYYLGYQYGVAAKTLLELAQEYDLTDERCRQLANDFVNKFEQDFAFVCYLKLGLENPYQLNMDADLIYIDDNVREQINEKEGTAFSNLFVTRVFALLLHATHSLVGYENNTRNKWEHVYLVKKELVEQFDFYGFKVAIKRKTIERNELPYRLDIKDYLIEFKTARTLDDDALLKVLTTILYQELELIVSDKGIILIAQNTPVLNWQYIEEALLALGIARIGQPLAKITAFLQEQYPEKNFREDALLGGLNNPRFISFGKSGYYGLKTWEENGNIKGGTIRDIIYEYLENKTEPQHMHEITQYVKRFRDTEETSIYSNLQQEENERFALLPGKYIGLSNKDYSSWQESIRIVGGLFTRRNLRRFHGASQDELLKDFLNRGYREIQITSILQKKLDENEIYIDDQGIFWLNDLQVFADEIVDDEAKEEMIYQAVSQTPLDVAEQEALTLAYRKCSKEEIVEKLNQLKHIDDDLTIVTSVAYKRHNQAIVLIKLLRDFKCQICGHSIIKRDGTLYIEAAHITPKHQKGKETRDNILLLCPNHHKEFDLGDLQQLVRTPKTIEFLLNNEPHVIPLDQRN